MYLRCRLSCIMTGPHLLQLAWVTCPRSYVGDTETWMADRTRLAPRILTRLLSYGLDDLIHRQRRERHSILIEVI